MKTFWQNKDIDSAKVRLKYIHNNKVPYKRRIHLTQSHKYVC